MPGIAQATGSVAQAGAAGLIASYSREQELQADQLGAEYLVRTHYDPGHMVEVIEVLKNQERYAADAAKSGRAPPSAPGLAPQQRPAAAADPQQRAAAVGRPAPAEADDTASAT